MGLQPLRETVFVDSHAHLEGRKYDADRADVFARAHEAGVAAILAIGNGEGPRDVDCAIKLAEQHNTVWATLGVHPHEASLVTEPDYSRMTELARHPKIVAWGEIGLDYYYDHSPRDVQQQVFVRQLELARAAKLPVVLHIRPSDNSENAWEDCFRILADHWNDSGLGGILHCFTGTVEHARKGLDIGFMVSFAGNVTYPKAQNIRDAAKLVPPDRMLIETDCPYLAPIPHRGKRNEPAFVQHTAQAIADLRGTAVEQIGQQTRDNFNRFFALNERDK
jgi:TatD DNase family protein